MYSKIYYYTIHNKIYYYQWQIQQVPGKQQVPDKWRDACKTCKTIMQFVYDLIQDSNYRKYKTWNVSKENSANGVATVTW